LQKALDALSNTCDFLISMCETKYFYFVEILEQLKRSELT